MLLTDADRARVVDAIRAAEGQTSGEIYCVITGASSNYRLVPLAWAALVALAVPLPLIHFTEWPAVAIYLLQLVAFLALLLLLSRPGLRYRIVPARTKRDRAHAEGVRQFLARGLQDTEARTGVLIFVSVAERYAEILADAGIDKKVTPDVWERAVAALISGIRSGRPGDGFIAAIEHCTTVLASHVPPGAINRDELPNAVVEM
jgi:putative membrane protein